MFQATRSSARADSDRAGTPALARVRLSRCELETLELMARGFSCPEIARLKRLSVHTTRSHLKSCYAKLNVHSRTEAVYEAMVLGLVQPVRPGVSYHASEVPTHDCPTDRPVPRSRPAGVLDSA